MDGRLDGIITALQALRDAGGDREVLALSVGELVGVNAAFGALRRRVEGAHAAVASEIARQSRVELGRDSLAKKQGFRTPAALISATTGTSMGDAVRLVAVGDATAPRTTISGEALPARHPHVAAAIGAGGLSVTMAGMITGMLDRVAVRADAAALVAMEETLAERAPGLTPDQLQKLLTRAEAVLDPDGVAPREDELRTHRVFSYRKDKSGAIVFGGTADPESGAPIIAALEGMVDGMLARRDQHTHTDAGDTGDGTNAGDAPAGDTDAGAGAGVGVDGTSAPARGGPEDQRSVGQMRLDALADLCRHALGCDTVPTGATTTVVVRMDLDALETGVGVAMIDGIDQPLTATTARRMAGDAQIIPCVLGGDSEILDWGRAKRLFTPAQKLALAERDGGCASCGLPPAMTVAHHLRWWSRDHGPTDLRNGILLCTMCHHRIHDDGWDIHIDGTGVTAKVWFIPPPWIDPHRTPRLGGRARYDLTA